MSKIVHGEAQVLNLRLFLEGLEVPIIAATVDVNESAAAVAQLEIVGLDSALAFKPRTVVHLFFFDSPGYKHGPQTSEKTIGGERVDPTDLFSPLTPAKTKTTALTVDDRYRLLFMGELFSYTYQKTGSGARSVILNCIDFSNYWDTSFLFQVSGEEGLLDVPQIQPFVTGSDVFANTTAAGNVALLVDQLKAQSQLPQSVMTGGKVEFLSALMGILEILGGVSVIDDSKPPTKGNPDYTRFTVHGGLSPWHTLSERRVRLLDQLATDDGKTASSVFEQDALTQFLKKQSDLTSAVLSFRDILNLLMGHVYYSSFPNPCGRLLPNEPFSPTVLASSAPTGGGVPPTYAPPIQSSTPLPAAYSTWAANSGLSLTDTRIAVAAAIAAGTFQVNGPLTQLSQNFTWDDLTDTRFHPSDRSVNQTQALQYYLFLLDLSIYILEPIRALCGAFIVTNAFRGPEYNQHCGGVPDSFHMYGQAADLSFASNAAEWDAFKKVALSTIPFGDCFYERGAKGSAWLHVSLGVPWGRAKRVRIGTWNSTTDKTDISIPTVPLTPATPMPT